MLPIQSSSKQITEIRFVVDNQNTARFDLVGGRARLRGFGSLLEIQECVPQQAGTVKKYPCTSSHILERRYAS